jgi:hypothetical protein
MGHNSTKQEEKFVSIYSIELNEQQCMWKRSRYWTVQRGTTSGHTVLHPPSPIGETREKEEEKIKNASACVGVLQEILVCVAYLLTHGEVVGEYRVPYTVAFDDDPAHSRGERVQLQKCTLAALTLVAVRQTTLGVIPESCTWAMSTCMPIPPNWQAPSLTPNHLSPDHDWTQLASKTSESLHLLYSRCHIDSFLSARWEGA